MDYITSVDAVGIIDKPVSATPLPDETAVANDLPEKISAYYSLAFPNFTYYVQTITVTIGRRSVRPDAASSSTDASQVDIDLGPLKSVSRLHARIEYDESQEQFVLAVLGRNGAWVDGGWSGSGSRVPLGPRSQIQIATRVFHFILPPAPDDSPSPSSPSSTTRHFSPSIDVTSVSPDSSVQSPAGKDIDLPATDDIKTEPLDVEIPEKKPTKANAKKRKKPAEEAPPLPPPDVMPPRPQATYAQLCYRAINSLEGKATLQEICQWISDNHDWYRYNKGTGWESSVRHNLSSNRAFKKLERCAGERGKGFFWSIDARHEHVLKDLEAKSSGEKGKAKNPKILEPPLKRSVKGDSSQPLPPPLSKAPLNSNPVPYQPPPPRTKFVMQHVRPDTLAPGAAPNTEQNAVSSNATQSSTSVLRFDLDPALPSREQSNSVEQSLPSNPTTATGMPTIPSDIVIPIVIGSIPSTDSSDTSGKTQLPPEMSSLPIALHRDTIILNPTIFSSLTPEQLKELEALGAKKAIEILQGYIVRFIKEKRKAESKEKKKAKKKRKETKEAASGADTGNASEAAVGSTTSAAGEVTTILVGGEPKALSPTSDMIQSVIPLRISTPPPLDNSTTLEEIDIMGEDDEPSLKRRRVDIEQGMDVA